MRTYINLILTMLLGGLWHGAAWNFIFWGLYQGVLLAFHRAFSEWIKPYLPVASGRWTVRGIRVASWGLMFACTLYGWLLFRIRSLDQLFDMTQALCSGTVPAGFLSNLLKMAPYIGIMMVVDGITFFTKDHYFCARHKTLTGLFYILLFYLILIFGVAGGEQFIYFAF